MPMFSQMVTYGGAVVTLCASTAYVLPHWLGLSYYKEMLAMYRGGVEQPLPDSVMKIANEELDKADIPQKMKENVKFFTAVGFDVIHKGSARMARGAYIGLPSHFAYESKQQVDKQSIRIAGEKPVPWSTPPGDALLGSLVIGPDAQRFAIATELEQVKWQYPIMNGLIAGLSSVTTIYLFHFIDLRLKLAAKKQRGLQVALLGITGAIGVTFFLLFKDSLALFLDEHSDDAVAARGDAYALAGVRYYDKLLARNVALRSLLGGAGGGGGERRFTAYGNDNTWFRTPAAPYTARRDALARILAEQRAAVAVTTTGDVAATTGDVAATTGDVAATTGDVAATTGS